jgi:hypothetical protein
MNNSCRALAMAFATLVSACAGRQEVRTLAHQSSSVLGAYNVQMSAFAARQTRLSQENAVRLSNIGHMRGEHEARVQSILLGWDIAGDKDSKALFTLLSRSGAADIVANSEALRSLRPEAQVEAVKYDGAQVGALIKNLKALEKSPSIWDEAVGALAFRQSLREAYRKSLEEAGNETAEAASAAAAVPLPGSSPQ